MRKTRKNVPSAGDFVGLEEAHVRRENMMHDTTANRTRLFGCCEQGHKEGLLAIGRRFAGRTRESLTAASHVAARANHGIFSAESELEATINLGTAEALGLALD